MFSFCYQVYKALLGFAHSGLHKSSEMLMSSKCGQKSLCVTWRMKGSGCRVLTALQGLAGPGCHEGLCWIGLSELLRISVRSPLFLSIFCLTLWPCTCQALVYYALFLSADLGIPVIKMHLPVGRAMPDKKCLFAILPCSSSADPAVLQPYSSIRLLILM